ncbi:MAG: TrkA family potassium uptake protein [Chloroflexi bacterium]|nr:TrkA family potassium uptake protein [Chloroflexota bacterium]
MFVVVIGAGFVGRHLVEILIRDKHEVVVIEKNLDVAKRVARELGARVVEGDGDDPKVLEGAGIRGADVFVAVTGEDEDNLVACTLAKFEFQVGRVMARVNNPKNEWMFGKDMGVDIAVNQADLMARLLEEEMPPGGLVTLLRLREGEVAIVEKQVSAGSGAIGRQIKDLGLPEDALCVGVLRGGKVLFPIPGLVLQEGDRVLLLTRTEAEQRVSELL